MNEAHIPVMLDEILQFFASTESDREKNLRFFDGTFGRGGHLQAILTANPNMEALAVDRDPQAIAYG